MSLLERARLAAQDSSPRPAPKLASNGYGWKRRNSFRTSRMKMIRVKGRR